MLLWMLIIGLIVYVITCKIYKKQNKHFNDENRHVEALDIISFIGVLSAVIGGIFTFFLCLQIINMNKDLATLHTYKEQNSEIEETIKETVEHYMNYEQQTFMTLKPKEAIQYVSLYPELKSNTLVEKQIELYIKNNELIKSLEIKKDKVKYYKKLIFYIPKFTRKV